MLADTLEVEPITLGRILDRLEAAELIERRRHARDRRIWQLFLRPKAHDLLAHMFVIGDATRGEALEGVSEDDRATLTRMIENGEMPRRSGQDPVAHSAIMHDLQHVAAGGSLK